MSTYFSWSWKHQILVMAPGIYVLAFYFREVREQAVLFLPMSWSISMWYGSEFPRVLSRLYPQSIDIERSHQTGGEGRKHVRVRVCLRVLHQRGPAHVHVFFSVARRSTWTFCPWRWGLTQSRVEGRWPCRILVVHVSSSCTARSARTLVHVAQTVPQVCAVPNAKREVFGTLKCHRDDTGASGRRLSFKLVRPSSSRSRARAGVSSMLAVEDRPHGC